MRIHTDVHTVDTVRDALAAERDAGRIARSVGFRVLAEHASTARRRAVEVQLFAAEKLPGDGRRYGAAGAYGATNAWNDPEGVGGGYGATYDEWGWLLAALYAAEPSMIVGRPGKPTYSDRDAFHDATAMTYAPDLLAQVIDREGDPWPWRWTPPKRGAYGRGRVTTAEMRGYHALYMPRLSPGEYVVNGIVRQERAL